MITTYANPEHSVILHDGALYPVDRAPEGLKPTPYLAPRIVPKDVTDRQFAQGLALAGLITKDEAEAWSFRGVLPDAVAAFVKALPEEDQFGATMLLGGATTFERENPMVASFGKATGMDADALDGFWQMCGAL
jgi:hypothetical protein